MTIIQVNLGTEAVTALDREGQPYSAGMADLLDARAVIEGAIQKWAADADANLSAAYEAGREAQ